MIHSRKAERYRCNACRRTFSARRGTVFYRKKTPSERMTVVLTLLAYGCPIPAVVAAFGLDERTVAAWLLGAGSHCQAVHERIVQSGRVELEHVQADELWVKRVGGKLWLAMALCVPSRLWLGECSRSGGTKLWPVPWPVSSAPVAHASRCWSAPTGGSRTKTLS